MILEFLICTVLQGQINNDLGCIGLVAPVKAIKKVFKDSPADRAGLVKRDEILSITNEETGGPEDLYGTIGETLVIKVKRRECLYTSKPYKSCPLCNGKFDIDVIKTFVVKREPCKDGE